MKLSSFKLINSKKGEYEFLTHNATVDETVSKGILWWKKTITTTKTIHKDGMSMFWIYLETGEHVDFSVDALARAWTAQTGESTS